MDAAPIQWRPLGQILVDRGLLSPEELEEVLLAQQETGRPLGQILVDRRLISAPTLASMLAEQCGVELETDSGFGTGLWSAIQRRHDTGNRRRADLSVVPAPEAPVSEELPAVEEEEPHPEIVSPAAEQAARSDDAEAAMAQLAEANARVVELEEALQEREQELEQLEKRQAPNGQAPQQAKLRKQLDQVEAERHALAQRADDLRERQLALEARAAELAEHERELAEREQAMTGRQRAILTAAADLEERRRSLEEREHALARRDAEQEQDLLPPHEVVPSSTEVREFAERHAPVVEGYSWNLDTLTRLVEESADDFPERIDDWRYTLFYLRNEARIDGALPSRFDSLVEECFAELLGSRERVALTAAGAQPTTTL